MFYIFAQNFNFIVRYKTYRYETLGFYTTNFLFWLFAYIRYKYRFFWLDVARQNRLAAELLHAEPLTGAVTSITGTSA